MTKRNKARNRHATARDSTLVSRAKGTRRVLSSEAEETINAIRAGQVDALVIQGRGSDKLYAIKSFADIERVDAELKKRGVCAQAFGCGAARNRKPIWCPSNARTRRNLHG